MHKYTSSQTSALVSTIMSLASLTPMKELVAIDMPASQETVEIIKSIWEEGNGFAPIDQRLPIPAKTRLIEALKPSRIISSSTIAQRLDGGEPLKDDQCLAMATSGTTGNPKIVVYNMAQIEASAKATSDFIKVETNDKWLCCLPISHIGGLSVILRSLIMGNSVEVQSSFDPANVTNASKRGATLVSLVPSALSRIDPYLFRKIVLGGSKPPDTLPANTMSTYGLTETGSGVVYNGWAITGLQIEIASDDEILLKGPMIATHYRDGKPIADSDGWLHTKDAGRLINGKLEVFGRLDERINTGGEKVFPSTVESILLTHPKISEVAVLATPDRVWGEAVTAVIKAHSDEIPTLAEVREFVKATLPSYYAPTRLVIVESMPTTPLGKIQKHLLKEQIIEDLKL